MNITTALLMFLAWQVFGKGGRSGKNLGNFTPSLSMLSGLLNDDTKNLIDSVSKVSSPVSTGEDKMAAIFQLMTNPAFTAFANTFFSNGSPTASNQKTNDQGYVYKETPSKDAIDFFKPVENIAGTEAAHKLYKLYDNWYSR